MAVTVRTMTPVMYVTDLAASVSFYRLLGFEEIRHGDDGQWSWWYGRCHELGLLLARGDADPQSRQGPVQLYCQCDDVAALQGRLEKAGAECTHLGHPDHAPGGEIRALDPDDHVVIIAQTQGASRIGPRSRADHRISILQAAEAARRRGASTRTCEIGEPGGEHCPRPGEVKLTDTWGESAWGCLDHADEVLFTAIGVYVATEDTEGLAGFLSRRRAAPP